MLESASLLPAGSTADLSEGRAEADFGWCERVHMPLLRQSFEYAGRSLALKVAKFRLWNMFWLPDYALFMALKTKFAGAPYQEWPEAYRARNPRALRAARYELEDEIAFWEYAQYLFSGQWRALKRFANARGVKLFGDMPIYVDIDSADVWANSRVFALNRDLRPEAVAGVPPDYFSEDGQLWGNPLYDWESLRRERFHWWAERIRAADRLFDAVRIDHFRAISNYWAVPAGAESAKEGSWRKGPGMSFVRAMRKAAPNLRLIAEDLGLLDDGVRNLLRDSGLPGMRVLQFAFSTEEESTYLPHNIPPNCVAYTGTHDNDTVRGWLDSGPEDEVKYAKAYFGVTDEKDAHWSFIRGLYSTAAELVIAQMQDVLGLPGDYRMNKPGIPKGNWAFRLTPEQIDASTAKRLRKEAETFRRYPWKQRDAAPDVNRSSRFAHAADDKGAVEAVL
jgi:4-alpha-glucanotransferase